MGQDEGKKGRGKEGGGGGGKERERERKDPGGVQAHNPQLQTGLVKKNATLSYYDILPLSNTYIHTHIFFMHLDLHMRTTLLIQNALFIQRIRHKIKI